MAVLIALVGGWLVALIVSAIVRAALRRTKLDERIAALIAAEEDETERLNVTRWASRVVYYLIMLFVVVAFLQALNLTVVAEPINQLLNQVLSYLPLILGAAVLLFVAGKAHFSRKGGVDPGAFFCGKIYTVMKSFLSGNRVFPPSESRG